MEYNNILDKIEEQKKSEQLSAQLFRYAGLIQAIEFFSQKLNFEQILHSGFDFVNELLTIEKSVVFSIQGNGFALRRAKGIDAKINFIGTTERLESIAVLHGTLIFGEEQLARFFDKKVLDEFHVTIAIPLIIENILYGFVLIANKTIGTINSDDYIISEALMKLLNNALENYKRYEELQKANKELDEKIFNLFAINQSSKALLSELSLDMLYNLSVDVFSELTQNAITGFVLFDEKSEKYCLKAFKDVMNSHHEININLTLNSSGVVDANKIIINGSDEMDKLYFNSLFQEGYDALGELKALYIVMLVKNGKILGFVTLSNSVTGMEYKHSMFELIESLASATYIALSNAQLFNEVNEQKKIIQSKLEKLISLNSLMKNINTSSNLETLVELTLKTLEISFQVDKALFTLYDKEKQCFDIVGNINIETKKKDIKINDDWKKVLEGDSIFESTKEGVLKYISKELMNDVGVMPGILIIPIYIDRVDAEILGTLIIFRYLKAPIGDEENKLTLETISGHISPVLSNLFTIEEQKRFLLPNYIEMFKNDLKKEVTEAIDFAIELEVIQVIDNRNFVFKGNTILNKLRNSFEKVYPFSYNHTFIILKNGIENADKKIKRISGLNDGNITVEKYILGKDFKSYQEFFKLF